MKSKNVILDTNLWISFLITSDFTFLDKYIQSKNVTLIFSQELIQEFLEVASRPKFRKYFAQQDIETLLSIFDKLGTLIQVNSQITKCRDSKDNFLLNLAIDGKADYLVTGDKDLLELQSIKKTKILTITELKTIL